MPGASTSRPPTNELDMIMTLQIGVARLEERLAAQGEATTAALKAQSQALENNTAALKDLRVSVDESLKEMRGAVDESTRRTDRVEADVARLRGELETLRGELQCHKDEHTEAEKAAEKADNEAKVWLFRWKLSAKQSVLLLLGSGALGVVLDMLGAWLKQTLGIP